VLCWTPTSGSSSSPTQFDFANSFRQQQAYNTIFLRAPRQPGGQRTYKLTVAEPLPTCYGHDICIPHRRLARRTATGPPIPQ